jgi:gluconokinase
MGTSIVIMGVAGCGKSSLAAALARAQGLPLIEGDDHHSEQNRSKMSRGIALTDEDRDGWLTLLGEHLRASPDGAVLTCSALKRKYRDQLRAASPGLRFVFLDLTREEALARVSSRSAHFFSASLVDSQFATLEAPVGESGVLRLEATLPLFELASTVAQWISHNVDLSNGDHPGSTPTADLRSG